MKGAHRVTKLVNGRRVKTGSYILQISTRFPSCKRLQLSTSVYPESKNASAIIAEMKAMLKEMNRKGDLDRFIQLRDKKVKLIDLYNAWKLGKEHLLYGNEGKPLLDELESYRVSGVHSPTTEIGTGRWIATFKKRGFLKSSHFISDLPQIVQQTQHYYRTKRQHQMYNLARQYFLGFLKKHCGHSAQSPLYLAVQRIEPLKTLPTKAHHPFESPSDVFELIKTIESQRWVSPHKKQLYTDALKMMVFHPFRPTEFLELKWEHDALTGHMRIKGTKTPQSVRVVPLLFKPSFYHKSHLGTYRLTDRALNKVLTKVGSLSRTRDCRRTWSIWAEKAGIERSHLLYYMGHKGREQTDTYQHRDLTRAEIDLDHKKLETWIQAQSLITRIPKKPHDAPSTKEAAYHTKQANSGRLAFLDE